jgi:hypothetical protein
VGIDRRSIVIAGALVFALSIWATDRWASDWLNIVLPAMTLAFGAICLRTLGLVRGAAVALLAAAAVNRFPAEIGGVSVKPEHMLAPIAALALLPDLRETLRRIDLPGWLLLAWLVWSVVPGVLNAPDPGNSTRLWVMLMLVGFAYFAAYTAARNPGAARWLLQAWLVTGILVGVFGLLHHFAFQALDIDLGIQVNPVTRDPTVAGSFYEANLFGSAMMMLGLAGITLLALGSRMRRLALAAAVVGVLAIQVSYTRTAWVAFVGGLVLVVIVAPLYANRLRRFAPNARAATLPAFGSLAGAAALGTLLLWVPFSNETTGQTGTSPSATATAITAAVAATGTAVASQPGPTPTPRPTLEPILEGTPVDRVVPTFAAGEGNISGRVSSIGDLGDSSVKLRWEIIKRAVREWRAHPIVGLGIGSFGQRHITTSNEPAWLSNIPTRVLHDSGLVGLLLFGSAIALLLWRALLLLWRPYGGEVERETLALGVAIVAMFAAFMATEGFQLAWYWFSLGLFAGFLRLATVKHSLPSRVSVVPADTPPASHVPSATN